MTLEQNNRFKRQLEEQDRLDKVGLYSKADEKDACGVGLVADVSGKPSRRVVESGIEALKSLWHRGAVDADGRTGDGAGIRLSLPRAFFDRQVERQGQKADSSLRLAVGMLFLPRNSAQDQEQCRVIVEEQILQKGYRIYGWRRVPIDVSVLGEKAAFFRPEIEQIMISGKAGQSSQELELDLYIIRKSIENLVIQRQIQNFYICSLSSESVIYKGMFLAEDLAKFYPDLESEDFISHFAVYHQRYSTNTFPTWSLAQPFRVLAHNGEINTLKGNVAWVEAYETLLEGAPFGDDIEKIKPVLTPGLSDSAALDAVMELLVTSGKSLPLAKSFLVPEAWHNNESLSQNVKDFYGYTSIIMAPWDGPAALCMAAGDWALCGMDRNGLRPLRYTLTKDGLLIAGSETGVVVVNEDIVAKKGRLGPGEMLGINFAEQKLYFSSDLKEKLAKGHPYGEWLKNVEKKTACEQEQNTLSYSPEELKRRQLSYGLSMEDMELILHPMGLFGKEALASMGDDTPTAVLSDRYRPLHHYFRQNFSQVTNPPIDSLRESRVMDLTTRLRNIGNILQESSEQCRIVELASPVLTNADYVSLEQSIEGNKFVLDCTYEDTGEESLSEALARIQQEAAGAVRRGAAHLVLTDEAMGGERCAIPMILATGAVHSHLRREKLRTFTSLIVRSGECLDVHYFAVLIGLGATVVNAYLTEEALISRHERGLFESLSCSDVILNYKESVEQGLLKIMSKMGISVVASYRGGGNFEAIGLSRRLVSQFFPGVPSRISGIGLYGIHQKVVQQHEHAWPEDWAKEGTDKLVSLPVGGFFVQRSQGERHAWEAKLMHLLQSAVGTDSYRLFREYSKLCNDQDPIFLRDLLDFNRAQTEEKNLDKVESITQLRKRFLTPGMSLGALSEEAHGTLNVAMNRIGAKSVSGEGGEIPERYHADANGDNWNSAIKQVASGRFGVTASYLNECTEIEIKVAQGAKPGEGGQLPGFKVTETIARLRHSTPGVTLISPPPHHDIYSIEDLAQLIYDLKQINPVARVCVKLVSRAGIGTIAAGVAKAKADVILVSSSNGGTGASPQNSVKYAGLPWELGLSEVHQALSLNHLRDQVTLRVDGGLRTGRDIVIGALLGAEEFGIGTASLVAMGCLMVRQCHSNTCPVGICTQDEALRKRFGGTPEKVINLFSFLAEEVREILASLGAVTLEDIIGRTDLLYQVSRGNRALDSLDLNPILAQAYADREDEAKGDSHQQSVQRPYRSPVPPTKDAQIIEDAAPLFRDGEKMQLEYAIENTDRTVGTALSSKIVRQFGPEGLQEGHVTIKLKGSAGQSLGAFAVKGLKLQVYGDANDYVGKGLSGATIVVRPRVSSTLKTQDNSIIGNTVLYGATSGKLFAAGRAGERFAVRNSGVSVVVEGCGANGCEYMTGGTAVILGEIGENFGAGMTGGNAFLYCPEEKIRQMVNLESVDLYSIQTSFWDNKLRTLIEEHAKETGSLFAQSLLHNWDQEKAHFVHVVPKEMKGRLEHPLVESGDKAQKVRSA